MIVAAAGDPPPPAAVEAAVRALAEGRPVGIPTDTVYGLAVDPFRPGATDRIFAAKRRPREVEPARPGLRHRPGPVRGHRRARPRPPAHGPVLAGTADHRRPGPARARRRPRRRRAHRRRAQPRPPRRPRPVRGRRPAGHHQRQPPRSAAADHRRGRGRELRRLSARGARRRHLFRQPVDRGRLHRRRAQAPARGPHPVGRPHPHLRSCRDAANCSQNGWARAPAEQQGNGGLRLGGGAS